MKILSRIFSAIVLGMLVVAAGIVFSVRSQEHGMKAQLETVFQAYRDVLGPTLQEVSQWNLTDEERRLLDRSRGLLAGTLSGDVNQDTAYMTNAQQALRALTVSLASHEEFAQNPTLTQLKTETSLQGKTAEALQKFNALALAWNQRDRSTVGQWISSVLHLDKVMMLNPDGRSEVMPTVTL